MDILNTAAAAASQSDRVLLVALFLVFLSAIGILAKWFLGDRQATNARLTEITDRHIAAGEKLSEVVTNNTAALNRVSEKIASCELRSRTTPPPV